VLCTVVGMSTENTSPLANMKVVRFGETKAEDRCWNLCLYGKDVGVPEHKGVAYPHTECPLHGDNVVANSERPDA